MRSGDAFTHLLTFDAGFPDADITWVLRDGDGTQIDTDTVTPAAGDVSAVLTVSGSSNTVPSGDLYVNRELRWSYAVDGVAVAGEKRYRVEEFLGFGVSREGVRFKLGLEDHEAEDESIDLVGAYASFRNTVGAVALAAITDAYAALVVCDAIEALAALKLLPALQVKLVSKEVSGVSQFQRAKVDWEELTSRLNDMVAAGYTFVNPDLNPLAALGSSFLVVTRLDPITGA